MRHNWMGLLLIAGSSILTGCGGQAGIDGTVRVTGTVTHQSGPVPGATVIFAPAGATRAASGLTDASGSFELTTLRPGDGVLPGKYQVAISKTETVGGMTEEESMAYVAEHGEPPTVTVKDLLPEKYKTVATSELTAEVTEGGKNHFTFDLAD